MKHGKVDNRKTERGTEIDRANREGKKERGEQFKIYDN